MFRIRKLDIFVTKQFALLFVGTFFICQFVLMMQFLWAHVDKLIGKGLSMEVLGEMFWHMGLMLVPQALPLAILLATLITFGNLGESSELTAIKSAGISLMQVSRPLIIISVAISVLSLYFQNTVGPKSNTKMAQIMLGMKQTNPELEIPEGVFYDGIPGNNLYVRHKDMQTGKLYGMMIYRMTGGFEDQAIILADSGMLQATADKKHLMLTLWHGEWFENMKNSELGSTAAIPYRRETFIHKKILLDYDGEFNMADATGISSNARTKSLSKIYHDKDSIEQNFDSIGRAYLVDFKRGFRRTEGMSKRDSGYAINRAPQVAYAVDTAFNRLSPDTKRYVLNAALNTVQSKLSELEFKSLVTDEGDKQIRQHTVEAFTKYSLALICIIFFFIGMPLGAIIRKGGLGLPVLISVLVFIVYYILSNSGSRMARGGMWAVWFGVSLPMMVLVPIAIFFTRKACNDSMVFNPDFYADLMRRIFGLRRKRYVFAKEVIISNPDYIHDIDELQRINSEIVRYAREHHLMRAPSPYKVFFRYEPDHEIERINDELETVIDDLGNSSDRHVIGMLSAYPILSVKAHTRPFEKRWLNIVAAVIVPIGIFLYLRMWRFRVRLLADLKTIRQTSDGIAKRLIHTGIVAPATEETESGDKADIPE